MLFFGSLYGVLFLCLGLFGIVRRSGYCWFGFGVLEWGGEVCRVGDFFLGRFGNEGWDLMFGCSCFVVVGMEWVLMDFNFLFILVLVSLWIGVWGVRWGLLVVGVWVVGFVRVFVGGNGGNVWVVDVEVLFCCCFLVGFSFYRLFVGLVIDKGGNVGWGGGKCGWSGKGYSVGCYLVLVFSFVFLVV